MFEITTSIEIEAGPHRVFETFIDFASYPQWNPFIRTLHGSPVEGARLKVVLQPPGGKAMTFRPRVLRTVASEEFRWLGHLLLPGLFDGEHYFRIEPIEEARSRFIHGEIFSGLLVPVMKRSLDGGVRQGFEEMNRALKARVEAQ